AAGDSYGAHPGTPLVVAASGVLGDDTDPDGDALTAAGLTGPSHGTLALGSDGSFTYMPADGYTGPDTFTYDASDGIRSNDPATVTLHAHATTHGPWAAGDAWSVAHDQVLTVAAKGVLANDADEDGDPLTAQLVSGPSHGTLALSGDGSFSYTPDPGYAGTDTFSYRAFDGL